MYKKEKYKYEVASDRLMTAVLKLTACNGILVEKPIVFQVMKKLPSFVHPTVDYCIREAVTNTSSKPPEYIPRFF
jgi:hypothetical protein